MAFVGQLPDNAAKKYLHHLVFTSCFQILGGALSAVITYHNPENRPKQGICVANHTSPIDVLILACDNSYALVSKSLIDPFFFSCYVPERICLEVSLKMCELAKEKLLRLNADRKRAF